MSIVNGIHVTPGPFSLYRRAVVVALGGFKSAYQTEDLEMALRLQKAGYAIDNAPEARVYTKAPRTLFALLKQRTRWNSGFLRNILNEYRGLFGNPRYGALGTIVLPAAFIAIGSGMLMFVISLSLFAFRVFGLYATWSAAPLSYSLTSTLASLDWFYVPTSLYLTLAIITICGALAMIIMGKRLSNTPGSLFMGILSYLFLYGLIAPLWLIRATADVALGKNRAWR